MKLLSRLSKRMDSFVSSPHPSTYRSLNDFIKGWFLSLISWINLWGNLYICIYYWNIKVSPLNIPFVSSLDFVLTSIVMCHLLMTGICSVVRQFCHCWNIIESTSINLDRLPDYTPSLCGIAIAPRLQAYTEYAVQNNTRFNHHKTK